jgi:hypothetical protein
MVHAIARRLHEGFKAERVACINRFRGLLAEFGPVFAQGPAVLQAALPAMLEDASNEMNALARLCVQQAQWRQLDAHTAWCDERIAAHAKDNADVKTAATLMGIGPIGASAAVATVGDFKQFGHAAQFGAWIGLTPRQHSSGGGKNSLGGITKRGDNYLRSLLIQGAKSAVTAAHMRSDPISLWAAALRQRLGWQKAAVALANKNARILWAVMTRGEAFNPRHVSVKPGASMPTLFDDERREVTSASRASPALKAVRSEHAKAKDASKHAEDGLPLHSFRTLLKDPGTLSCNVARTPANPNASIVIIARPRSCRPRPSNCSVSARSVLSGPSPPNPHSPREQGLAYRTASKFGPGRRCWQGFKRCRMPRKQSDVERRLLAKGIRQRDGDRSCFHCHSQGGPQDPRLQENQPRFEEDRRPPARPDGQAVQADRQGLCAPG